MFPRCFLHVGCLQPISDTLIVTFANCNVASDLFLTDGVWGPSRARAAAASSGAGRGGRIQTQGLVDMLHNHMQLQPGQSLAWLYI